MGTLRIIEVEIATEAVSGISAILICFQIHFFVLNRPPKSFDEQVIIITPLPIHADSDSMFFQETGEGLAGELSALIGVKDIRSAFPQRLFQRLDAEVGVQGIGEAPGEHVTAVPVDDSHQRYRNPLAMGI